MSYHAIEDLVEDQILLLKQSGLPLDKQRNLIYNLYQFQNLFDTSYTVLRQAPFLTKMGYLRKIPIEQHPDYQNHRSYFKDLEDSSWIKTDVGQAEDSEVVYFADGCFFPSYGSRMWERLVKSGQWNEAGEPPVKLSTPTLFVEMLGLAEQQQDLVLMKNLYLVFLLSFLEFDLSEKEGLPAKFEDWANNSDLLKLRELLISHDLLKIKRKETALYIPVKINELSAETDPERIAKIEFLMSPKKSIETIIKAYQKDLLVSKEISAKIRVVKEELSEQMKRLGWSFIKEQKNEKQKEYKWLWYKDLRDNTREFTEIILFTDLRSIVAKQFMQHSLLLDWQQKEVTFNPSDSHFENNPFEFIYDDDIEKKLNYLGLWVLPLKAKLDKVLKSLKEFMNYFEKSENLLIEQIDAIFPKKFFSKSYRSYEKTFDSDEPIEGFLLVKNLYSISLLLIYHLVSKNEIDKAIEIYELMEKRLTDRFRNNVKWYSEDYLPYINAIRSGKKPALPRLFYLEV